METTIASHSHPFVPQVALDDLDLIVATQKLNVERSADLQTLGDQHRDAFDAFDGFNVELLRGQHEGGVALRDDEEEEAEEE